jgi:hypothetical protein
MKDEGGRMKEKLKAVGLSFILPPSAFILFFPGCYNREQKSRERESSWREGGRAKLSQIR